ncbi:MAG: exodeoxyribonuclease VII small subunit [Candidatus Dormiibacterota bacterium]
MAEAARDIEVLTYEQALAELEGLIRKLETGSVDLADSIASYERGVALANHCSKLLEQTEAKVQRLVLGPKGQPSEQPFELTADDDGDEQ